MDSAACMLSGKMTTKKPTPKKRPADVVSNAVHIMRVLTGEADDTTASDDPRTEAVPEKNPAAVALGRMGGKARAASIDKKRRSEIARKAAITRWKSTKE